MTRAAVIGLGRIASTWDEERSKYDGWHLPHAHIGCMAAVPEIEIVGLSDTWSEQREAARAKWGIDALYADYREMLAKTRPQIVSICTSMKPVPKSCLRSRMATMASRPSGPKSR